MNDETFVRSGLIITSITGKHVDTLNAVDGLILSYWI